jgi:hypothetical protein
MPSLFADQFNYAGPYGLNGLPASTPSVSLRLPESSTPQEPAAGGVSTGNPASDVQTSSAAASAAAAGGLGLGASNAMSNMLSKGQGSLNSMSAMFDTAGSSSYAPGVSTGSPSKVTTGAMVDRPANTETTVTSAPAPSRGILGDIGHGFDTARHAVSASTDWLVNAGGDPNNASSPNSMGSAKTYAPGASADSGVTYPTSVINPSGASRFFDQPGSSGNGTALGVSSPAAIESNPAYNEAQFGRLQTARNAAQSEIDNSSDGTSGWLGDLENFANSTQGRMVGADDEG